MAGSVPMEYNFDSQELLLHEPEYADFEIKCDGHTFRVHKVIICGQSNYMKALAGSEFKEAKDGVATISEEDPAVVARYLLFLYTNRYTEDNLSSLPELSQLRNIPDDLGTNNIDALQACRVHLAMHTFARKIVDTNLEIYSLQRFSANWWMKEKKQTPDNHRLQPEGPTRTLKYHVDNYSTGQETTIIVGTKNTRAEVYDLFQCLAPYTNITITQRVVDRDAAHAAIGSRTNRQLTATWKDNSKTLEDFGFDGYHLIVQRSVNSSIKSLSLLAGVARWSRGRVLSDEEKDLIRHVLTPENDCNTIIQEMIALDLVTRRSQGLLIPDEAYTEFAMEFPRFFLKFDRLAESKEVRQCKDCLTIQPSLRKPCACATWAELCGNEECKKKTESEMICFYCLEKGKMRHLREKRIASGESKSNSAMSAMYAELGYDYLSEDEM